MKLGHHVLNIETQTVTFITHGDIPAKHSKSD